MKFMVDESAGTAVAEYLRGVGHDVLPVSEAMPQAEDQHILARAMSEGRILVTNEPLAKLLKAKENGHSGQAKRDPESRIFKQFWIPAPAPDPIRGSPE